MALFSAHTPVSMLISTSPLKKHSKKENKIKRKYNFHLLTLVVIICSGCQVTTGAKLHSLKFNGLIFQNNSGSELELVTVKVLQTGIFAACNRILLSSSCSTTFKPRSYQENPIQISWLRNGIQHSTHPITISFPDSIQPGKWATVVIKFKSAGAVTAKFEYR